MISRVRGILVEIVDEHRVLVEVSGISYEILLPSIVMKELRERHDIGDEVTISTLFEFEGAASFGNLSVHLVGFLRDRDRDFFQKIVAVKDFGTKRAMKALAVPIDDFASAIERADIHFLTTLPEIGKRSAEKLIAELKGKVLEFLPSGTGDIIPVEDIELTDFKAEALKVLLQLGYKHHEAKLMITRATVRKPELSDAEELVKEIFSHIHGTGA